MKKLIISFVSVLGILSSPMADPAMGDITNPASSYAHTVDGQFTDWSLPSSATYEWFDIIPQKGQYSYVYFDYDGSTFYIMNDWFVNTQGVDPTNYNLFQFSAGADTWDFRVYGDGTTQLLKNNVADPTAQGAFGFGRSPNLTTTDHTIWEIALDIGAETISTNISDPKTSSGALVSDPEFPDGFLVTTLPDGGSQSAIVPLPPALILGGVGLGAAAVGLKKKRLFDMRCSLR
jgi:hypothetical protein